MAGQGSHVMMQQGPRDRGMRWAGVKNMARRRVGETK